MLIEFVLVALILYLISVYLPMPGPLKLVFNVFCVAIAIYYLLAFFGVSLPDRLG